MIDVVSEHNCQLHSIQVMHDPLICMSWRLRLRFQESEVRIRWEMTYFAKFSIVSCLSPSYLKLLMG